MTIELSRAIATCLILALACQMLGHAAARNDGMRLSERCFRTWAAWRARRTLKGEEFARLSMSALQFLHTGLIWHKAMFCGLIARWTTPAALSLLAGLAHAWVVAERRGGDLLTDPLAPVVFVAYPVGTTLALTGMEFLQPLQHLHGHLIPLLPDAPRPSAAHHPAPGRSSTSGGP